MGKWLQGDLKIDKYAWEIDLDGYYLSQIEINISISPLHPLVATWLIFPVLQVEGNILPPSTHMQRKVRSSNTQETDATEALSCAFTLSPAHSAPHHSSLPTQGWHPWSPTSREVPRSWDTNFEKMGSICATVFYPGLAAPSFAVTVKSK